MNFDTNYESPCKACHLRESLPFCRQNCGWLSEYQERLKDTLSETHSLSPHEGLPVQFSDLKRGL